MSLFALTESEALDLAERHGSPCFAYRLDIARDRYLRLRSALPRRVVLAYAVKANPGRRLIAAFASAGASFDCASIGELELMRGSAVPGSRILFAGPGKSHEELCLALELGARIQVDGIEDLERLEEILASRGPPAGGLARGGEAALPVNLRVHPRSAFAESSRIIGGTGPSAFGVDEEDLLPFLGEASRLGRVRIAGLQVFAASNERSAERLLANHRAAFEIGRRLQAALGHELDCLDLGGGLGIPYAEGEEELDIAALGHGLGELLEANPWFGGEAVLEPGRWLAGPCGVYLVRVLRTKTSRGERFAILEAGVNHLLRPALTGQAFPTVAPRRPSPPGSEGTELAVTTLAGPLCTSLDRLGRASLPRLRAGDLLMLGQAGAYGFTESMTRFLSHPEASEHWLDGPPAR